MVNVEVTQGTLPLFQETVVDTSPWHQTKPALTNIEILPPHLDTQLGSFVTPDPLRFRPTPRTGSIVLDVIAFLQAIVQVRILLEHLGVRWWWERLPTQW